MTRRRGGDPMNRRSWRRSHRFEGTAGVRACWRLCPSHCRRHGGCGPLNTRGSHGADRRYDRAAACR
jgi:hypothetical protein